MFVEPAGTNPEELPYQFRVSSGNNQAILIRLLAGSIDCIHLHKSKLIKIRKFHREDRIEKNTKSAIRHYCSDYDTDPNLSNFDNYLKLNRVNNKYFESLCREIAYAKIHEKQHSSISCFFHCYRSLEKISFTFPLLYSSVTQDYLSMYTDLKGIFTSNSMGELKFLEKFIDRELRNHSLNTLTIDIELPSSEIDKENHKRTIRKLPTKIVDSIQFEDTEMKVPFKHFSSVFIETRNKFMHFSSDYNKNFSMKDDFDIELYLEHLNSAFFIWFKYMYSFIIEKRIDQIR